MCQILQIKLKKEKIREGLIELINHKSDIKFTLDQKGGDNYSVFIFYQTTSGKTNTTYFKNKSFEKVFQYFKENITRIIFKKINRLDIVFFSRQVPEMESDKDTVAPYVVDNSNLKNYLWLHGTISNDKELAKKYNLKDYQNKIDSEIVAELLTQIDLSELQGLYTILFYNNFGNDYWINNGLGVWEFKHDYFDIRAVTPTIRLFPYLLGAAIENKIPSREKEDILYVSYSGGMDISLSTFKTIYNKLNRITAPKNLRVKLIYFDYGTQARKQEIKALDKFTDFLYESFKNINNHTKIVIEKEILDIKEIIEGFVKIYGNQIKFFDKNAKGDISEAETNHSYVPFRNSLFIEILKTKMDGTGEIGDIVLGLNLSEGQVFGDNNSYWLEGIERVARTGGKKYDIVNIISPYIDRTKTNMLKEFKKEFGEDVLNQILDISFSCYYPKEDGSACGVCGSCILRQKSIKKIKN